VINPRLLLENYHVLRRGVWERKKRFVVLYLLTAALFLVLGWYAPRVYTSSSTVLIDKHNILGPLMEGTAIATGVVDRAKIAREVILSRKSLQRVLRTQHWLVDAPDAVETDIIAEGIKRRTEVSNAGRNLIRISYRDRDAKRAFETTRMFTDIFISASLRAKQNESRDAFQFIDSEVEKYRLNLEDSEQKAKRFRQRNLDARPGTQAEVNENLIQLRRKMERTQTQIQEAEIKRRAIKKQISGEAEITISMNREQQYNRRLESLQTKLDTLRLSYLDTYPDIVRIKHQIKTIRTAISTRNIKRRSTQASTAVRDDISKSSSNPLYQELRSKMSATKTRIVTLKARLAETRRLQHQAEQQILRIDNLEAALLQLRRDYQVNQEMYQRLLKQREKARISMNIDLGNRGLSLRIQEPATLPVTPKGIRFGHFVVAGLIFSFLVPLGIVMLMSHLDGRIRTNRFCADTLGLPVLASIGTIHTVYEIRIRRLKKILVYAAILGSWFAYSYAIWLRLQG